MSRWIVSKGQKIPTKFCNMTVRQTFESDVIGPMRKLKKNFCWTRALGEQLHLWLWGLEFDALPLFFHPMKADKGMTSCLSTLCLREILLISWRHSAVLLNNFCWARSQSSEFCTLLRSSNADGAPVQRQIKTPFEEDSRHFLCVFSDCDAFEPVRVMKKKTICHNIYLNINDIPILFIIKQMFTVPTATFSVNLLHQSSIQIIQLQLPADINSDCIVFPIVDLTLLANPFGEKLQMCQDHQTWQAAEQWAETPHKDSFKPQGSADSGDNSMKIYHENWPLPLCSLCHYKCIDWSAFKAVKVCDNWTTVILAINYKS